MNGSRDNVDGGRDSVDGSRQCGLQETKWMAVESVGGGRDSMDGSRENVWVTGDNGKGGRNNVLLDILSVTKTNNNNKKYDRYS